MPSFNLTAELSRRTTSPNTQRAYYRWMDRFLVDVAGLEATSGDERLRRMQDFPVRSLRPHLNARRFKSWLDALVADGQGRQALDQARATVVTVSMLLSEAGYLDAGTAEAIQNVSVPLVRRKDTPERLLNADEVRIIMSAAREMATTPAQHLRNQVVATMLCTMALRREELSAARWGDLAAQPNGLVVLKTSDGDVDMPRPVLAIINRWRAVIGAPAPETALIRRIWKGGGVAKEGLSPDGIWLIIGNAANFAGLGHVTPDDLRRSAVANMYRNGMPVEEISRLLRHRSVLITERFLAKLPLSE